MSWNPDAWLNIPQELQATPQWMVCNRDKVPLNASGLYKGDWTNPNDWCTFSKAYMVAEQIKGYVGFCFTRESGFIFLDMDNKAQSEEYKDIILGTCEVLDTYIERSMNGDTHAILKGRYKPGYKHKKAPLEVYDAHFGVLTGDVLKNRPISTDHQDWLDMVAEWCGTGEDNEYAQINLNQEVSQQEIAIDDELIEFISAFKNAPNIEYWFYGWDFHDPANNQHSENDAALMQLYHTFNKGRIDRDQATIRMFLKSPRAHYLTRKTDPHQYVMRTFSKVKAWTERQEPIVVGLAGVVSNMSPVNGMNGSNVYQFPSAQNGHIGSGAHIGGQWMPPAQQQNPFVFFSASELKTRPDIPWAIHNLLPVGGLAAIYGESGAGKSFIALDMIGAIARGVKWFRRQVMQLPVCCLALEGSGGLKKRVLAWESAHHMDFPDDVKFYDGAFSLRADKGGFGNAGNVATLVQFCKALNGSDKFGGVVFVDTLNQASEGADENSSRDMNQLIQGMKLIQQLTGSLVVAVHHATKNRENQSMRGHGSFKAACDAVIEVYEEFDDKGKRTGNRGWIAEKVKDSESGETGAFQLKKEFGTNSTAIKEMWEPVHVVDEETGDDRFEERPVEVKKAAKATRGENAPFDGASSERQWSGGKRQQEVLSVIRRFLDGKRAEYEQVKMAVTDALLPSGASGTARRDLLRVVERLMNRGTLHLKKEGNIEWVSL